MPLKTQPDDQSSINLTPMIDIVFLLIIFFMVGTKFSELNDLERDISIKVPAVSGVAALTTAPRKRVINVHADGRIDLDKKMVSLGQLRDDLVAARQQYKNLGVVIRGDESSQYGNVASVFATCQKAGISDLNISVRSVVRR